MRKPTIVCLCGSSRFYKEYQIAEYQETMAGRIYLSIGFYPHAAEEMHGEGVGHNSEEKIVLDELHKRKIDLADEVLVLNVGGYIGDSTKSEVAYAIENGKPVRWLEPENAWQPDNNETSYAQLREMVQRARGLIENGKFDSPSEADDWITDAVVILENVASDLSPSANGDFKNTPGVAADGD